MGENDQELMCLVLLTRELCSILVSFESRKGTWVQSSAMARNKVVDGQSRGRMYLVHTRHATSSCCPSALWSSVHENR